MCKDTSTKLEYNSFVGIESTTGHAEMKMDFKWNGGSPHFSFQAVTTKTNQTRGYCSRKFKVDRSESTFSKKNVSSEVFIVKKAVETSLYR